MDNDEQLVNSREAALLMARDGIPVSRQRVSQVAKRLGWAREIGAGEGCPWLYRRSDILDYVAVRKQGRPLKVRV